MLFLTEQEVIELLPMELAIECVEKSFIAQDRQGAINQPRARLFLKDASLHYMAAALPDEGFIGMKIYIVSRGAWRFVVLLYETGRGELVAFIEADHLGRIRTGAASGVATKYLSRTDAATVGVIGSGRQAKTQLQAVAVVRRIRAARVYSPDDNHCRAFAREMGEFLSIPVEPVESAETAAASGDIIVTATPSREPVLKGEWLTPGAHVNAIGANMENRREVDDGLLRRASVIAVDSLAQARIESGDLIQGFASAPGEWDRVVEMWEIVAGRKRGRESTADITLFKSAGMALWDVAVAGAIYRRAREAGRGREIALSKLRE